MAARASPGAEPKAQGQENPGFFGFSPFDLSAPSIRAFGSIPSLFKPALKNPFETWDVNFLFRCRQLVRCSRN